MNDLNVRIVKLEPMRVAAALGFGSGPEPIAWEKILGFARSKGLLDTPVKPRFFGFNNPNPSPASPNYGYEQWMTVDEAVAGEGEVQTKVVPGGLYAVMSCPHIPNPETWMKLVAWRENSRYQAAPHQWLEECLNAGALENELMFDLYLPIRE